MQRRSTSATWSPRDCSRVALTRSGSRAKRTLAIPPEITSAITCRNSSRNNLFVIRQLHETFFEFLQWNCQCVRQMRGDVLGPRTTSMTMALACSTLCKSVSRSMASNNLPSLKNSLRIHSSSASRSSAKSLRQVRYNSSLSALCAI